MAEVSFTINKLIVATDYDVKFIPRIGETISFPLMDSGKDLYVVMNVIHSYDTALEPDGSSLLGIEVVLAPVSH